MVFFFFFAQADSQLQTDKRLFHQTALDYVVKLQEVNEKKKFEFVETVSMSLKLSCLLHVYEQKIKFGSHVLNNNSLFNSTV